MKIESTINSQRDLGDAVLVTLTNCRAVSAAEWQEYGPEISIRMNHSKAKNYPIGRRVIVTVEAK